MISAIDANYLVRFFLKDDLQLFTIVSELFDRAQKGKLKIYLDEVIVAEVIWVLSSRYKIAKNLIATQFERFISEGWLINPRKDAILNAIDRYAKTNLSYVDCWLYELCKENKYSLATFDRKLAKIKL
jgi:predicted nucleic-acid-binding protein